MTILGDEITAPRFAPSHAALESLAMSVWSNAARARAALAARRHGEFRTCIATIDHIRARAEEDGRGALTVCAAATAISLRRALLRDALGRRLGNDVHAPRRPRSALIEGLLRAVRQDDRGPAPAPAPAPDDHGPDAA